MDHTDLLVALIAALAGGVVTLRATQLLQVLERKKGDSELILSSMGEYTHLFRDLVKVRSIYNEHKEVLARMETRRFSEQGFELVKLCEISDDEWEHARKIKMFFKNRFFLLRTGFFSEKAIAISMDRYGNELMDKVCSLDIYRFYKVHGVEIEAGETSITKSELQFEREFGWYSDLNNFLKNNGSIFFR